MKTLSEVVINTPKSKVRKLFDMAAGKSNVISLGIGQPDFPSPDVLIEGTIKALKEKKTMYPPTRGLPELLKIISKKEKKEHNIESNWENNVIVTTGGSQAISLAMAVTLNPKDEVALSSPNFLSYLYVLQFNYAKAIEIKRNNDLSPDFDAIKKSITPKTKLFIVNSPNNPTGYVYKKKDWESLANIIIENDLYLLSDECYDKYLYDDNIHISPASLNGMAERTITLNSISKTYSATGLRLGYVIANQDIITLMEKYHQYTTAGVNHPIQYGTLAALSHDISYLTEIIKGYSKRRDLVYDRLNKIGLTVSKPGGAFYIMPSIRHLNISSDDFAMQLMDKKAVAVVPGDIFGKFSDDRIRISYATDIATLNSALDRIEDFVSYL
ncbi:MAG: pyridoxal phosphate-dependent aminotransferase [Promethearchaeota archaeon]